MPQATRAGRQQALAPLYHTRARTYVWPAQCTGDTFNLRARLLTVQAHNWRCLRCTFNTARGITQAESRCTQVRNPALFVLNGGEAGELPRLICHTHPRTSVICR